MSSGAPKWKWKLGGVDPQREHFRLSYRGDDLPRGDESHPTLALVGRADSTTLAVDFLGHDQDLSPAARSAIEEDLNSLTRHAHEDMWAHLLSRATGAPATLRSRVHWDRAADARSVQSDLTEALRRHNTLEKSDQVPHDREMTDFRRRSRLHQALWREDRGLSIGGPLSPKTNTRRAVGSWLEFQEAKEKGGNFLSARTFEAVKHRLTNHQDHEAPYEERLLTNLLGSMPMCFNLLGELWGRPLDATQALRAWISETPGTVEELIFEWSPGRMDPDYLNNKSAFDAAFVLELSQGKKGIVGIETKYHEYAKREDAPLGDKLLRYAQVTEASGIFERHWRKVLIGTALQQIWLDHLLALSMLQHPSQDWNWARFLLVYPERNLSFAGAAERYGDVLKADSTFEARTLEQMLDARVLPATLQNAFAERYLWYRAEEPTAMK